MLLWPVGLPFWAALSPSRKSAKELNVSDPRSLPHEHWSNSVVISLKPARIVWRPWVHEIWSLYSLLVKGDLDAS